jgi:hypothetical protein
MGGQVSSLYQGQADDYNALVSHWLARWKGYTTMVRYARKENRFKCSSTSSHMSVVRSSTEFFLIALVRALFWSE